MSKQAADAAFAGGFVEACYPEIHSRRASSTSGAVSNFGTLLEERSAIRCDGGGLLGRTSRNRNQR
jgi:hypothetical protein